MLFNTIFIQMLLYGVEMWGGNSSFGSEILNILSYQSIRNKCSLPIEVLLMQLEYTTKVKNY